MVCHVSAAQSRQVDCARTIARITESWTPARGQYPVPSFR
jgi:hypothetical protein